MNAALKPKLAVGALVVGCLAFLDGVSLLCYCPGPFVFAIPFTIVAVLLSSRWSIRVIGVCLCVASVTMGVHQFERKQHLDAKMRAIRAKAETNSIK